MEKTKPIKKVARVLEMCSCENSNYFINAIGGQELYSKEEFKEYGIDLYFIKMDNIEYKQFSNEFVPNLSIIDVLMHNGKEGTKELLNRYTLVWYKIIKNVIQLTRICDISANSVYYLLVCVAKES